MQLLNINKINNKQKIFIYIILFVFSIYFFAHYFYFPSITDINNYIISINNIKNELADKNINGQTIEQSTNSIEIINNNIENIEKIYIKKDEELKFITDLENLAKKNNIQQRIILGDQKDSGSKYKELPIQINANSQFNNLIKQLNNIENLDYAVNITSINFNSDKNSLLPLLINEETTQLKTTMTLSAIIYIK